MLHSTRSAMQSTLVLADLLARCPAAPVCVLDFPRVGGATYYSLRRIEDFLQRDRAVVRLTCNPDGSLNATAHYRDINARFTLESLASLRDLPPFYLYLVNELAGWTLPEAQRAGQTPVGEGRPRWIPSVLARIAALAELHKARLEYVLHDYFAVCPNFVLLDDAAQQHYCGVPDVERCGQCLVQPFMQKAFGPSFSMPAWREAWDAFLTRAHRITCPSVCSRDILLRAYAPQGKRIVVRPHAPLVEQGLSFTLPGPEQPMHIAVVGQLTIPKGALIVRDLALLLEAQHPAIGLSVIGSVAAPGLSLPDSVQVTGPYDKARLGLLLAERGVTCGLVPSVWPETFNYVTQELMQLGLPLVAFDVGAPAERIGPWQYGLLAKKIDAGAALAALCELDARRG